MSIKMEGSIAAFSPCNYRFVTGGYKRGFSFEEQLDIASKMKGIGALPVLVDENAMDPLKMKRMFEERGLQVGTVCVDTYTTAKWKNGTLSHRDKGMRGEMVENTKRAMDYCKECGGVDVMLWLAHDGYDYPFEDDYAVRWGYLVETLREAAGYRPDVNLTIEYKRSEPRTYQYVSDIGKSLLLCNEVGLPNMGVIIDIGHALLGGENPAESVALASRFKKLFHVHLNDNYRRADDDLIVGTVHFWETLEFFYRLNQAGYDGWYIIVIYPGRLDGIRASEEFVARANQMMEIAKALPADEIKAMQEENDTIGLLELVRKTALR